MADHRPPDPLRAALWLLFLLLLARVGASPAPRAWAPCVSPRAAGQAEGPTHAVVCDDARASGPAVEGPARLLFDLPIDVNHADAATLMHLPGIGPARARAIVDARCEAPFADAQALTRVHGIGPVTVRRLAGRISADPVDPGTRGRACAGASTLPGTRPR